MKKSVKLLCAFVLSLTVCVSCAFGFTAVTAAAAEDAAQFVTEQEGVTLDVRTNYVNATGTAGTAMKLDYNKRVDFSGELGASFRFLIAAATDTTISEKARTDGSNYIEIKVLNPQNKGVRLRMYSLFSKVNASVRKYDLDVFYVDPSIKASAKNADLTDGERYHETIEMYESVEDSYHTVDIHKEDGYWFIAMDGLTAMPRKNMMDLDLSDCTVTFEMYSKTNTPKVRLYPFQSTDKYVSGSGNPTGKLNRYVTDGFMQFGSDEISYPGDDTVKFKIADKRAAQYPGTLIRLREHLISTVGYDVRQPINIEYSYDVSNASAVWYAFGLGRPNVLDNVERLKFNVYGNKKGDDGVALPADSAYSMYGDGIAARNDGIMIQTGTGMAQPVYRDSFTDGHDNNKTLVPYKTNSASKPYSGRGNIDLVTFEVGETGTKMYMNGTLLFENLSTKLSDFEGSDYLAYPYFHFFEDNANTAKGNTIVIKGVNAPRRTDDKVLRVKSGSNAPVTVGLDDNDNGAIKLYEYVEGEFTEIDGSLYSYDAQSKQLTMQYGIFDGRDFEVYNFYARNNSGSEEISVRFSDSALTTEPPVFEKDTYYWKVGAGTEDLVIPVDIKNGIYSSFSGGGIMSSGYTFTPGVDSTVGTIVIKKEFLNTKRAGTLTFVIRTVNVEEDEFSAQVKIVFNKTGTEPSGGDDGDGDNQGGDGEVSERPGKKGCGGSMDATAAAAGAMLALCAGVALVLRRKRVA